MTSKPEKDDADWEWARQWVQEAPPWSERRWRRVNSILGYEVADTHRNRLGDAS